MESLASNPGFFSQLWKNHSCEKNYVEGLVSRLGKAYSVMLSKSPIYLHICVS